MAKARANHFFFFLVFCCLYPFYEITMIFNGLNGAQQNLVNVSSELSRSWDHYLTQMEKVIPSQSDNGRLSNLLQNAKKIDFSANNKLNWPADLEMSYKQIFIAWHEYTQAHKQQSQVLLAQQEVYLKIVKYNTEVKKIDALRTKWLYRIVDRWFTRVSQWASIEV